MFSILNERLAGLRQRYSEPHRAYHGQAHVDALLSGFADEGLHVENGAAVELAIWYHDAIYDPAATDNEARSADLLVAEMRGLATPSIVSPAESMVRATASHVLPSDLPEALRNDMATFLDLDMAILGAEPADYDVYESGIAAEYVPVHGLTKFREGRSTFLGGMLSRERLFHTERFHQSLDMAARANMRRGLVALAT
jgi:predicted metal-dependent HD superfamily phosphohydrolase